MLENLRKMITSYYYKLFHWSIWNKVLLRSILMLSLDGSTSLCFVSDFFVSKIEKIAHNSATFHNKYQYKQKFEILRFFTIFWHLKYQSSWSKGISETNLKLKIPCSKCMQQPRDQPMTSQANACSKCMHCPMMSQAKLHRLCCFNFVSDMPLLQLFVKVQSLNSHTHKSFRSLRPMISIKFLIFSNCHCQKQRQVTTLSFHVWIQVKNVQVYLINQATDI